MMVGKWIGAVVVAAFLASLFPALASADRILVRYESGTSSAEKAAARAEAESSLLQKYTLVPRLELIRASDEAALAELRANPDVDYAVLDRAQRLYATPNDTLFSLMWGMRNTGQTIAGQAGTAGADIKATSAWNISTGSADVAVAVIDSGVDATHPDLAGNIWTNPDEVAGNGIDDDANGYIDDIHGWDFVDNDALPADGDGHGTHVAGTIGAVGNNNRGVAGVNWDVSIVPLRGCGLSYCYNSDTIEALQYAVAEGIHISNNSYGGIGASLPQYQAIQAAMAAQHLFVAAAGNGGADSVGDNNDSVDQSAYPASYDLANIISVSASNSNDALASFSNYGENSVDLAAPGVLVASTYPDDNYYYMSGTSMASPHVAGAAALMASVAPNWNMTKIRSDIISTARPVAGLSGTSVSGGVLDLNAAVQQQLAPPPPEILSSPAAATSSSSATFSFSLADGANAECSLDDEVFSSCVSPLAYNGLSAGGHIFRVRQTKDGLTSTSNSYSWTIDQSAPDAPSLTSSPAALTQSTEASFAFTGEEGAVFYCALDSGPAEECSSPKVYPTVSNGQHTFSVYQEDSAGNSSALTEYVWNVDSTEPEAPFITSTPPAITQNTEAEFSFTGEEGAVFYCALDSGPAEECSSPHFYPLVSDGDHTFTVYQVDEAGNSSASSQQSWRVDSTVPSAPTITSSPAASSSSTTAAFSFVGEAGATFSCSIDEAPSEECSSPVSYSLQEGEHTFLVYQVDEAGNTSAEAGHSWTVDLTPPAVPSIVSGPGGKVRSRSATFSVSGSESLQCSLDGAGFTSCPSPVVYSGLSDGQHELLVRSRDAAGNVSGVVSWRWQIDGTGPWVSGARIQKSVGRKYWVFFQASDVSGLSRATVSTASKKPRAAPSGGTAIQNKSPQTIVVQRSSRPRWIAVSDSLGNWSGWQAIR